MDSDSGAFPNPPDGGGHDLYFLVVAVVLVLAVAAAVGAAITYYVIKRGEAQRLERVREAIFATIRKALENALKERGPKMVTAIEVLLLTANQQLGPFMGPSRSILAPLDALAKGLTGKTTEPSAEQSAAIAALAAIPAASFASGATTPGNANANAVSVTPALIANINVVGGRGSDYKPADVTPQQPQSRQPAPQPQQPPPPPPRPVERYMTVPEQKDALTRALDNFDHAWRRERVLPFLKEAQTALLTARPVKDEHDNHGGGHGH